MLANPPLTQISSTLVIMVMIAKPKTARHSKDIHSIACKSLKFLFALQFLMCGDQPGSKLLLEGLTKIYSALLVSYLNVGRREAFSTLKAWDVFCMLEQLKKDFVFKLGMYEVLEEDQGL